MTSPRVAAPADADRIDFPLVRLSLVLMFAAIIALLDTTIVNVAIESLAGEFGVSLGTVQWVSTGYLLAVAVAIPVAGWAIDRFGGRRVWLAAVSAFLAGSLLAGLAWDAGSLIAFRVVQGLGGGMIEPVVMAMVARAAGPKRIGRAMSLMLIPINLGPVVGPVIGGLIVDQVSWRWIFLVNLPAGIVSLLLGLRYIPRDAPAHATTARLDITGVLLLSPGFAALVYGLTASAERGGFGSGVVLASVGAGLALIGIYVTHALRRRETALLDVRLFANSAFTVASLAIAMIAAIGFATIFLLPLYFQVVRGESALDAGLLLAPFGVGMAIGMAAAGAWADRVPARTLGIAGALLTIASSLALALVEREVGNGWIGAFAFARGVGMALVAGPTMANLYRLVQAAAAARATTAMYMVFQVGASLGVAGSAVVLQARFDSLGIGREALGRVAADSGLAHGVAEAYALVFLGQAGIGVLILGAVILAGRSKVAVAADRQPDSRREGYAAAGE